MISTWLLLLIAVGALAFGLGADYKNTSNATDSESGTAAALLATANADTAEATTTAPVKTGNIVWHATGTAVDSGTTKASVQAMLDKVASTNGVKSVVSPYTPEGAGQLNAASGTAYARVTVDENADTDPIINTAEAARAPNLDVEVGGRAFTKTPSAGGITEIVGVLVALAILLVMFRSGWAAMLPIATGVAGVTAGVFTVMLLSHVVDLADSTPTMGALIGLGVGIDYALFIVNRFRKALSSGTSVPDAVTEAVTTSGRAVLFAGGTVIIALIGVFVVNIDILTGMARGAAITVAFTVLAALTLLPALMAALGPKLLPRKQRNVYAQHTLNLVAQPSIRPAVTLGERWAAVIDRVPVRLAVGAALIAVLVAIPALSIRLGSADASSDPKDSASHQYFTTMSAGFGEGIDAPLLLVARTPDSSTVSAFNTLAKTITYTAGVAAVAAQPAAGDQSVAVLTVIPTTSAQAQATADLVNTLREDVIPAAEQGTDLRVYVGGITAANIDNADATLSKIPLYLLLIAVLGFLLLAVAFRSILVPLIGAVSNLIVLAIGMAVLTAAFQWGWVTDVLGVGGAAPIDSIVPVLLIGIVFGLSMDYQVFLVSRMHEEWTHTHDNQRSVRVGLAETSKVIAVAALIMLSVFAAFGFAGQRIIAEIGVGLGLAVVADAFLTKLVLIPALMRLIGDRNWWYPRWADKITPHVSVEGAAPSGETALGHDDVAQHHDPRTSGQERQRSGVR